MDSNKIEQIFNRFQKNNPYPKIELEYTNNFSLIIAIVLSAQATDIRVNKVTKDLFAIADTPQKMLDLGEEKLINYINTIGLHNSKAKNIIKLSQILSQNNYNIPENIDELLKLPGIGRKSANVFLNNAFNTPAIGVDTHVFRVSNRIGLVNEKNVLSTEKSLSNIIPEHWKLHAHHWLVLHGRYTCKARKPLCSQCIISDLCEYPKKNLPTQ